MHLSDFLKYLCQAFRFLFSVWKVFPVFSVSKPMVTEAGCAGPVDGRRVSRFLMNGRGTCRPMGGPGQGPMGGPGQGPMGGPGLKTVCIVLWLNRVSKSRRHRRKWRGKILDFWGTFWKKIHAILSDLFICRKSRTFNSILKCKSWNFINKTNMLNSTVVQKHKTEVPRLPWF